MDLDFQLQPDASFSMDVDGEENVPSASSGGDCVLWQSSQSIGTFEKLIRQSVSHQTPRQRKSGQSFSPISSTRSSATASPSGSTASPSSAFASPTSTLLITPPSRSVPRHALAKSRSRSSLGSIRSELTTRVLRSTTSPLSSDNAATTSGDNATSIFRQNPTLFLDIVKGISEKLDERLITTRGHTSPSVGNNDHGVNTASNSKSGTRRKAKDYGVLSGYNQQRKSPRLSAKGKEKVPDSELENIVQRGHRPTRTNSSTHNTPDMRAEPPVNMEAMKSMRRSRTLDMPPPPVPHKLLGQDEKRSTTKMDSPVSISDVFTCSANYQARSPPEITHNARDHKRAVTEPTTSAAPRETSPRLPSQAARSLPDNAPSSSTSSDLTSRPRKLQRTSSPSILSLADALETPAVAAQPALQPVPVPAPAPTTAPAPAPPPPRASQGHPPALGMKRVHTLPAAKKPNETGLPAKQKGFKPPLLSNSQPNTTTTNTTVAAKNYSGIQREAAADGVSNLATRKTSTSSLESYSSASTPPSSACTTASTSINTKSMKLSKKKQIQSERKETKAAMFKTEEIRCVATITSEEEYDEREEGDDEDDEVVIPKSRRSPSPASSYAEISFDIDALEETMQMYD